MGSTGEQAKESTRYMRMTIYFNKKEDLTDEEFHRYWSDKHGPLFRSLPVAQEKLVKYNQYHNSMDARKKAASLGLPVLEFDAAADFYGADMDAIMAVFQDPEYLKTVVPDEDKFVTRVGAKYMFGYEDLKMDRT